MRPDIPRSERRRYSLSRVLLSQVPDAKVDAGYEIEVSQELARRGEREAEGLLVPTELAFAGLGAPQAAGLDTATATAGAEMVFEEYGGFLDLLRPRSALLRMGATYLPGLVGDVSFVRQTDGSTITWRGENPGSDVADSDAATDLVTLSPKIATATTSYSRKLMAQGRPSTDAFVARDLLAAHATGIDLAGIAGGGGAAPLGILNTTGIGDVALGANGAVPTYQDFVALETDIEDANAGDVGTMGYITTPGIRGVAKSTPVFAGAGGIPIWTGPAAAGEVNGYAALATRNVPSDLDKGTSTGVCHAVIFGAWDTLLIGEWGMVDLIVDPYALKKQGMIEVTSHHLVDVQVQWPAAFSAIQDALTS